MPASFFSYRSICLTLALSALVAGCNKSEPAPAADAPAAKSYVNQQEESRNLAKTLPKAERRSVLTNPVWAKQATQYAQLMKKAASAGDTLDDKATLALGGQMYSTHVAFQKATNRDFTRMMHLLRRDVLESPKEQQNFAKFTNKLRTLRAAKGLGSPAAEQRQAEFVEKSEAARAEAKANAKAEKAARLEARGLAPDGTRAPAAATPKAAAPKAAAPAAAAPAAAAPAATTP